MCRRPRLVPRSRLRPTSCDPAQLIKEEELVKLSKGLLVKPVRNQLRRRHRAAVSEGLLLANEFDESLAVDQGIFGEVKRRVGVGNGSGVTSGEAKPQEIDRILGSPCCNLMRQQAIAESFAPRAAPTEIGLLDEPLLLSS